MSTFKLIWALEQNTIPQTKQKQMKTSGLLELLPKCREVGKFQMNEIDETSHGGFTSDSIQMWI